MARLVLTFLALSLLMVGIVGAVSYLRARSSLEAQVFDRLNAAEQLKADSLDRWIDEQRRNVVFVGGLLGGFNSGDSGGLGKAAEQVLQGGQEPVAAPSRTRPSSRRWSTSSPRRRTHRSSSSSTSTARFSSRRSRTTRAGTSPRSPGSHAAAPARSFSRSRPPALTGKPAITIATPLFDRDGQRIGVVAANLNLERLDRIVLPASGLGKTGASYLVGANGRFVHASLDAGPNTKGVSSQGIDRAIAEQSGQGLYTNYRDTPVIGVYRWLPEVGAALVAEQSQSAAFAPARTLAFTLGGVGLLVAGLLAIGTYLAARRIARPILAITDTAEAVAAGDLAREAPVTTNDEVGARWPSRSTR